MKGGKSEIGCYQNPSFKKIENEDLPVVCVVVVFGEKCNELKFWSARQRRENQDEFRELSEKGGLD